MEIDGYTPYIIASYAIAAVLLGGLTISTIVNYVRIKRKHHHET